MRHRIALAIAFSGALAPACGNDGPGHEAPPPVATSIPAAPPGARGPAIDRRTPTPVQVKPSKELPRPLPPDPFGADITDEDDAGSPASPPKPPTKGGIAL